MKVGFIGIGVMGGPMAANILKKGHQLTVYDLDAAAVKRLTDLGATAAATPKEVGAASEVVVTMLPDGQAGYRGSRTGSSGHALSEWLSADRKSTRLNSSHPRLSRMPSSA